MSEAVQWLTRGNVTEVKIVFASILAALAFLQVALMAVGYGKLSLRQLSPAAASRSHRAIGDTIVVLAVVTAAMCVGYFEVEDDNFAHSALGTSLVAVLAVKVAVVRKWLRADALLPWLGIAVLVLFVAIWFSSAASFLA